MSMVAWLAITQSTKDFDSIWPRQLYRCTQEPGDIMFVPDSLLHGVINDGDEAVIAFLLQSPFRSGHLCEIKAASEALRMAVIDHTTN
eukprot:554195-Prymnesium_polylepis.1